MPKIDIAKIENYATMTAEEKLAALEAYEFEADATDAEKLKAAVSKANSEAAELKRKLKEKQTDDERKEAERLEAETAIKAELEALRKDKTISDSKSKFLSLGYDEKLAADTAQALANGDMEKVFVNQGVYIENVKKSERASALAGDPKPPAGKGSAMTKEQFSSMSLPEKQKLATESPELYQTFYKKE